MTKPEESDSTDAENADEKAMAVILAELLSERRAGRSPDPSKYLEKHSHLREAMLERLEAMDLLEETVDRERTVPKRSSAGKHRDPAGQSIGSLIDQLPAVIQRLIVLRNFENRRWTEIAQIIGQPEIDLRREFARAMRELVRQVKAQAPSTSFTSLLPNPP